MFYFDKEASALIKVINTVVTPELNANLHACHVVGISVFSGGQPLIIRTRGERKPFIIIFRFPFEDPVAFFVVNWEREKRKQKTKIYKKK